MISRSILKLYNYNTKLRSRDYYITTLLHSTSNTKYKIIKKCYKRKKILKTNYQ